MAENDVPCKGNTAEQTFVAVLMVALLGGLICMFYFASKPTKEYLSNEANMVKFLQKDHELVKIFSNPASKDKTSYFLLKEPLYPFTDELKMSFAWKSWDGSATYLYDLPLSKFKTEVNDEYTTPTIRFVCSEKIHSLDFNSKVEYALIKCKPSELASYIATAMGVPEKDIKVVEEIK